MKNELSVTCKPPILTMSKWVLVAALLVSSLGVGRAVAEAGNIWHVPTDYDTLQDAIHAASDGDMIIVGPGTYVETIDFLGKAIHLTSSDGAEATVIDANGFGTTVTCVNGEGPTTILEGFTITGGTGTVLFEIFSDERPRGGGMLNIGASPIVRDCIFAGNQAELGGGMYNIGSGPRVENCVFQNNHATTGSGGGMHSALESEPLLTGCLFQDNMAEHSGGGLAVGSSSTATVKECIFRENTAGFNGGGAVAYDSTVLVEESYFQRNAALRGGGMYSWESTVVVRDSIFRDNVGESTGGLSVLEYSSAEVINCVFEGNQSTTWGGGAMVVASGSVAHLDQCIFAGNEAVGNGGGLRFYSASGREHEGVWSIVKDCTFEGNHANSRGGGVSIIGSPVILIETDESLLDDSVIRGFLRNTANEGGGLFVQSTEVIIDGVLFLENHALNGGGIFTVHSHPTITAARFESNSAEGNGGGIRSTRGARPQIDSTLFCANRPDHINGTWDDLGGNTLTDDCNGEPEDPENGEDPPGLGGDMCIKDIDFAPHRNGRHLDVIVTIHGDSEPLAGVAVTLWVNYLHDDGLQYQFEGTTGTEGSVAFRIANAASVSGEDYEAWVTALVKEGWDWSGDDCE